jgi:ArsR family transcriptional regulator
MAAQIQTLAAVYRTLADPTRLRVLALLADGEVCVCHIHQSLKLPQPTVSRHLAYLRRAGLVETRRDGLWVHYRLAAPKDSRLRAVVDAAVHAVGHVTSTRADRQRLERHVVRPPSGTRLLPVLSCCAPAPEPR